MSEPGRVVVGVSGSPGSLQALRAAVDEARSRDAALIAVLAWTPAGGEFAYHRAPCLELLRMSERDAAWRLRNSFDEAFGTVPGDVRVELALIRGEAGAVLVGAADRPGDLLVVGAGPHGRIDRILHGATARYCVARAGCRVLTVPPPELLRELPRRRRHRPAAAPQQWPWPAAPGPIRLRGVTATGD
jgi:nucleotide-binding universal stress UspA family protein